MCLIVPYMSNYRNESISRYRLMFGALANQSRLQIFDILSGCCTDNAYKDKKADITACCVGDLGQKLKIAPSTLSHHLKEMNRAGLIDMRRDGKQVYCSINQETLQEIRNLFSISQSTTTQP